MFVYPTICRLGTRTAAEPTAHEEWYREMVLMQLNQSAEADNWLGILALESEARAVAAAVLAELPQNKGKWCQKWVTGA